MGTNVTNETLCDKYKQLCEMTREGFFINLDFRHPETGDMKEDSKWLCQREQLYRVNAAMQLLEDDRLPLISEHIDFST